MVIVDMEASEQHSGNERQHSKVTSKRTDGEPIGTSSPVTPPVRADAISADCAAIDAGSCHSSTVTDWWSSSIDASSEDSGDEGERGKASSTSINGDSLSGSGSVTPRAGADAVHRDTESPPGTSKTTVSRSPSPTSFEKVEVFGGLASRFDEPGWKFYVKRVGSGSSN